MKIETLGLYPFREKRVQFDEIILKISKENNEVFNKLKAPTSKFLNYLIQNVVVKEQEYIIFDKEERNKYMKFANIQHQATVNSCLKDLKDNHIIANTNIQYYFWLNTNILE